MQLDDPKPLRRTPWRGPLFAVAVVLAVAVVVAFARLFVVGRGETGLATSVSEWKPLDKSLGYVPNRLSEDSGFGAAQTVLRGWPERATLAEIAEQWDGLAEQAIGVLRQSVRNGGPAAARNLVEISCLHQFDGRTDEAYASLCEARRLIENDPEQAREGLMTVIFYQGVLALRKGENENCIMCRGESSCIFPIAPAAVHINPEGSRLAIRHFNEYLEIFPEDLGVRWLLNLAHMTLGEWPDRVDPKYRIDLSNYLKSEFDIGRFRDIGHRTGLNHFNQSGGGILEDFDNDGLLDVVTTSFDCRARMTFFRNLGDGIFREISQELGLKDQLGGLYCVQTDYNNDGLMDIYIPRGAWLKYAIRPSLLRNDGNGFTDVTEELGLLVPVNSITASWSDYDNDGWLDLFVCSERQENKLFHNPGKQGGRFLEVAKSAGVSGDPQSVSKGSAWLDYDNDDYPDLFINHLNGSGQLFKNNKNGTFTDVSSAMGIAGPRNGFSCWAWDYNNDGWLDIFATSYNRTLPDIVNGIIGRPHHSASNALYLNRKGKQFENVTAQAGLDSVYCTMGSKLCGFR